MKKKSKERKFTDSQAHALAELYVWSAIISLLEGSTSPRTSSGSRAAQRVIKICNYECAKLIQFYDYDFED